MTSNYTRTHALCFTVLLLAWGLYWLAFFPGVVSHDALGQWRQVQSGRYDDNHPAFHTFLLWLLTRPSPSFGVVSGVHTLLAAGLVAYLLGAARRLGSPVWLVSMALVWLAVLPIFGVGVIGVGRDSSFALALLWTTALLLRLIERGMIRWPDGVLLGVALGLLSLLRHNGPAIALPIITGLAWRHRRAAPGGVAVTALSAVTIFLLVRGPLYRAAGVAPMSPVVSQGFLLHQVAAHLRARTRVTDDEAAFLSAIAPLPIWRRAYNCADSYPLLFHSELDLAPLSAEPGRLVGVWAAMAVRSPAVVLRHWRCVTAFVRRHRAEARIGPLSADGVSVAPNALGVSDSSLAPRVRERLAAFVQMTRSPRSASRMIVWQPAFSLDLLLGSLAVALWRCGSWLPVLLWLPALCNTLVWLAGVAPTPHLRYQWPVILLAPMLVSLAAMDWRELGRAKAKDVPPSRHRDGGWSEQRPEASPVTETS